MKQRVYETNAEYIESMMKQFKLVDMREQYRDLILEAESSAMDYESFQLRKKESVIVGQTDFKRKHVSSRKKVWKILITALTILWIRTRSQNLADLILSMPARMSLLLALQELGKV